MAENAETASSLSDLAWYDWLTTLFPEHVSKGFAPHHEEFWEWVWNINEDVQPAPFIAVWPRGAGKSSSCELASAALMMRKRKSYILYVRSTQSRADDSVGNIASLLEGAGVEPSLNRFGQSKGWRRNRIRTASNGTVDGLGLDVAARGIKLEKHRPDAIIFDDVDERLDSARATETKIKTITDSLLPAGGSNVAIIGVQNLVIPDGIFSQLADGRADFLSGRIVSGPHPAVEDMQVEEHEWPDGRPRHVITAGRATWTGQDLAACQRLLDRIGLSAFTREAQHDVSAPAGSLVYGLYAGALKRGDTVTPSREAEQFLGIDPGFARRAAMLAIQERADNAEMWKEWSFVRCDDDHIASVAAAHCLEWGVRTVFHDAESPELGAAIRKHLKLLYDDEERRTGMRLARPRVDSVPFNKHKRIAIKATRWLLRLGAIAWGAETTEQHEPDGDGYRVSEVPGVFRSEIKKYQLVAGKDDEAEKTDDHGPDAWAAYAARWRVEYQRNAEDEER